MVAAVPYCLLTFISQPDKMLLISTVLPNCSEMQPDAGRRQHREAVYLRFTPSTQSLFSPLMVAVVHLERSPPSVVFFQGGTRVTDSIQFKS